VIVLHKVPPVKRDWFLLRSRFLKFSEAFRLLFHGLRWVFLLKMAGFSLMDQSYLITFLITLPNTNMENYIFKYGKLHIQIRQNICRCFEHRSGRQTALRLFNKLSVLFCLDFTLGECAELNTIARESGIQNFGIDAIF
jgi:hypothetical protein